MNNRLLSIDVDAHLEKLATRSYRSPAHFPVELVRSALKRGAEKIDIQIEKNRFEIRDDGRPLDSTQLELLKSLLDTAAADKSREQAIIDLQDSDGIGLLAIFSSSPTRIDILTSGQSKEHILAFDRGAINRFESRNLGPDKPGRHQEKGYLYGSGESNIAGILPRCCPGDTDKKPPDQRQITDPQCHGFHADKSRNIRYYR
jgi:hypothetical protein